MINQIALLPFEEPGQHSFFGVHENALKKKIKKNQKPITFIQIPAYKYVVNK